MKELPLVNVREYVHLVKGREHLRKRCVKVKVTQSCPTLCHTMDCNLPGSSVHEILQAGILKWVAIPFSRDSSQAMDQTQVSCIGGGFFHHLAECAHPAVSRCAFLVEVKSPERASHVRPSSCPDPVAKKRRQNSESLNTQLSLFENNF